MENGKFEIEIQSATQLAPKLPYFKRLVFVIANNSCNCLFRLNFQTRR